MPYLSKQVLIRFCMFGTLWDDVKKGMGTIHSTVLSVFIACTVIFFFLSYHRFYSFFAGWFSFILVHLLLNSISNDCDENTLNRWILTALWKSKKKATILIAMLDWLNILNQAAIVENRMGKNYRNFVGIFNTKKTANRLIVLKSMEEERKNRTCLIIKRNQIVIPLNERTLTKHL